MGDEKPRMVTANKSVLHNGKIHERGAVFPMAPDVIEEITDRAKRRGEDPHVLPGDQSGKVQAAMAEEDEEDVEEKDDKTGEIKTIRRKKAGRK